MNVGGMMSGRNDSLSSVIASKANASGGSYAELSMNGRKTAAAMQQREMGKSAVGQMRLQVEETEESIEEQTEKALAEKKAAEAAEAQRVNKKGQGSDAPASAPSGDTVQISTEGKAAAQNVTVATSTPAAAPSTAPAPAPTPETAAPSADSAPAAPASSGQAEAQPAPESPQVDIVV